MATTNVHTQRGHSVSRYDNNVIRSAIAALLYNHSPFTFRDLKIAHEQTRLMRKTGKLGLTQKWWSYHKKIAAKDKMTSRARVTSTVPSRGSQGVSHTAPKTFSALPPEQRTRRTVVLMHIVASPELRWTVEVNWLLQHASIGRNATNYATQMVHCTGGSSLGDVVGTDQLGHQGHEVQRS